MKAILITGYHEKNSNIIHLFFRNEKKEKVEIVIDDFYPYFYIRFKEGKYESLTGEKLEKIICSYPEEVVESRKGYEITYESDVPFVLRFLIDKGIFSAVELPSLKPLNDVVNIKPRLAYLDIENVGEQMIAWSYWDSYQDIYISAVLSDSEKMKEKGNHVICYFDNELNLVSALYDILSTLEPDVVGGWNIGYDIEFLRVKFKKFGLNYNFGSLDYFDLYSAYIRLYKAFSTRLKDVAIDEGITDEVIEWDEAFEAWQNGDYDVMVKYNYDDVKYCVEIDKKRKLFEFFWSMKQFIGLDKIYTKSYEIVSTGTLVDTLALRFAKQINKALPKKGTSKEKTFEGGFVLDPIPGRHKNLAVFDFARTYPTVIIALNISPETKIVKNGEVYFDKSKKGLLPMICEYLLKERERLEEKMKKYDPYSEEWKILKNMRDIVKYTTNAVFGYVGWKLSRVYDYHCASTITAVSRDLIQYCIKYTKEELKLYTVYGDTDSTIIKIDWIDKFDPDEHVKELEKIGKKQTEAVSKYFREKYDARNDVKMKFERFALMGYFPPVKKRYVLRVIWEEKPCDEILIKGFEAVRTDTSKFARTFMKKLFAMILDENVTEDEIRKYVKQSFEEFKTKSLEEICMRKGLSKELHEYESKQDYIRAAIYANKYLGCNFRKGSKVKYVYIKSAKGIPVKDVIAFEHEKQIKDKIVIDWDRMIEKQLYEPIKDILKQIGIVSVKYKVKKFSNLLKR